MPLTITHAKSNTIADFTGTVTVFNSAGDTTTCVASDLVRPSDWNSAHQFTVSLTGSEVASLFSFQNGLSSTTGAGGVTAGISALQFFEPFPLISSGSVLGSRANGAWFFQGPYEFYAGLDRGQFNVLNTVPAGFLHATTFSAASTGSLSRYYSWVQQLALYKQGTGGSTSRLESLTVLQVSFLATWDLRLSTANTSSGTIANFLTLSFPGQWDSSGGVTYSSVTTSGQSAFGTSTAPSSRADSLITGAIAFVTGSRMDIFGMSTTVPVGDYWAAHQNYSSSSSSGTVGGIGAATNGTGFQSMSYVYGQLLGMGGYKRAGISVSNSTSYPLPFHGSLATTSTGATSIVNTSDIRAQAARQYWNYGRTTY